MSFSENISHKLTNLITNELDYEETKKEIIAYSIETSLLAVMGWFFLVLIGYALNVLVPTVLAASFGSLLRKVSGGAHLNDPIRCMAFGTFMYCAIGLIANRLVNYAYNPVYSVIILIVSLGLVSFLAPVDSESKPIHSQTLRIKLKVASMVFVLVTLLIVAFSNHNSLSISAALGIAYQSITLLPIFNKKGGVSNQ